MAVYIPCLNVQKYDDGGGFSVGVGAGPTTTSDGIASGSVAPGISITHTDSPVTLTIIPVPPYIIFGPNFGFWKSVFGMGQTKIDRQKEEIQDFWTPLFRYLNRTYGVPIRDDHFLQFPSDGVKKQFKQHPEIAAMAPAMYAEADDIILGAFGYDSSGSGIRERMVNQFLANAAYNNWPVHATREIWDGAREASKPACFDDTLRWYRDPYFLRTTAAMAVVLQYVPIQELAEWKARGGIQTTLVGNMIDHWAANPQLVSGPSGLLGPSRPAWLAEFQPPANFEQRKLRDWAFTELELRPSWQNLLADVAVRQVYYPDFTGATQPPIWIPPTQPQDPTIPPQDQTPLPVPPQDQTPLPPPGDQGTGVIPIPQDVLDQIPQPWPPTQPGQVLEIPPAPQNCIPPAPQVPDGCPPFPQPTTPPPTQDPGPWFPDDQPPLEGDPQQGDPPCNPHCQEQIDILWQRQRECCEQTELVVLPRLDDLENWVRDLEERVPGPPPNQPPPRREQPTEPPRKPGSREEPPEEEPPIFAPTDPGLIERIERIEECCDPVAEEERHRELERPLECVKIDACAMGIRIAGILAECWARTHTPVPVGVAGVFTGWRDASPIVARLIAASPEASFAPTGQGGQSAPQPVSNQQFGLYQGYAEAIGHGSSVALAWSNGEAASATLPGHELILARPWIFASPEEQQEPGIQYRTVALREDEIDPCTPTTEI